MSIDRSFRCNLCGSIKDPKAAVLFGLVWQTDVTGCGLHIKKSPTQYEHHICIECLAALKNGEPE
jgi:hypothetical protein